MKSKLAIYMVFLGFSYLGVNAQSVSSAISSYGEKYTVTFDSVLSSSFSEYAPRYIDNDCQSLVFTSNRDNSKNYSNLFFTFIQNNKWTSPTPLITTDSANCNYGIVSFDTKRKVLFYTKCPIVKNKNTHCQLYYSFMQGDLIGEQFPLNMDVNDMTTNIQSITLGHPYFSNDIDVLFFVSDMLGGYGGMDIWCSKYDRSTDTWGKPQNMGSEVNTAKNELYPSVSSDGTLYFTSDGHGGFGGWDIFKATKTGDLSWGNVTNMGEPINSSADDFAISFKKNSQSGLFSSNRKGGKGSDDIYSFFLNKRDSVENKNDSSILNNKDALIVVLNKPSCNADIESLKIMQAKAYPNPSRGEFTYECISNRNVTLTLRIYSSLGKVILTESVAISQAGFVKQYNLQNENKGIYYVQLLYNCEPLQTVKVIVN